MMERFNTGDEVKVVEGRFTGAKGVVRKVDEGSFGRRWLVVCLEDESLIVTHKLALNEMVYVAHERVNKPLVMIRESDARRP